MEDWTPYLTLAVGAAIALLSGLVQSKRQDRSESDRWIRDKRLQVYWSFLKAFDQLTDALHFGLSENHEEAIEPEPLLSIGNARQNFEESLSELALLGPGYVTELATDLKFATIHLEQSLKVLAGTVYSYRRWGKVRTLRHSFIDQCRQALKTDDDAVARERNYKEWVKDWDTG
jgi:hypothetical protein